MFVSGTLKFETKSRPSSKNKICIRCMIVFIKYNLVIISCKTLLATWACSDGGPGRN